MPLPASTSVTPVLKDPTIPYNTFRYSLFIQSAVDPASGQLKAAARVFFYRGRQLTDGTWEDQPADHGGVRAPAIKEYADLFAAVDPQNAAYDALVATAYAAVQTAAQGIVARDQVV